MIAARDLRVGDELRDEAGRLVSTIVSAPVDERAVTGAPRIMFIVRRAATGRDVIRYERPGRLLPFTRPERTNA